MIDSVQSIFHESITQSDTDFLTINVNDESRNKNIDDLLGFYFEKITKREQSKKNILLLVIFAGEMIDYKYATNGNVYVLFLSISKNKLV